MNNRPHVLFNENPPAAAICSARRIAERREWNEEPRKRRGLINCSDGCCGADDCPRCNPWATLDADPRMDLAGDEVTKHEIIQPDVSHRDRMDSAEWVDPKEL